MAQQFLNRAQIAARVEQMRGKAVAHGVGRGGGGQPQLHPRIGHDLCHGGVIASLAVFFALHTLFDDVRRVGAGPIDLEVPVWASWDPVAVAITGVALVLVLLRGWSPLRTLGVCAALGVGVFLVG